MYLTTYGKWPVTFQNHINAAKCTQQIKINRITYTTLVILRRRFTSCWSRLISVSWYYQTYNGYICSDMYFPLIWKFYSISALMSVWSLLMLIHVEYRASVTCLCHKDHCKQCAHISQYSDIRIFLNSPISRSTLASKILELVGLYKLPSGLKSTMCK